MSKNQEKQMNGNRDSISKLRVRIRIQWGRDKIMQ